MSFNKVYLNKEKVTSKWKEEGLDGILHFWLHYDSIISTDEVSFEVTKIIIEYFQEDFNGKILQPSSDVNRCNYKISKILIMNDGRVS